LDFAAVQSWVEAFSYPAVFLLLLGCGMGMPLSEDAVMIAGGIVTGRSGGSLPLMIAVAMAGVLCGDFILFRVGQRLGPRALNQKWIRKALTPKRVSWVTRHFHRYGALTVFIARFTIGFRVVTFISAGVSGVRTAKFVIADLLAAMIYVPLLVWLGWRFGAAILQDVESALGWIVAGVVTVVASLGILSIVRRRRRVRRTSPAQERELANFLREAEESA
jgi:membrane-associated protein